MTYVVEFNRRWLPFFLVCWNYVNTSHIVSEVLPVSPKNNGPSIKYVYFELGEHRCLSQMSEMLMCVFASFRYRVLLHLIEAWDGLAHSLSFLVVLLSAASAFDRADPQIHT